jgi:hypothetical protein
MRRRSHRGSVVVWSSSSGRAGRYATSGPPRRRRRRRWLRTGSLLAVIGLLRLARIAWTRWRASLTLAGLGVTAAGLTLPDGWVFVGGMMVLLLALLIPSGRDTTFACNVGWPRLWAQPCTPRSTAASPGGPRSRG